MMREVNLDDSKTQNQPYSVREPYLSENANRAFDYAVSLAESCNAAVSVIHVFEKLPRDTDPILVAFLGYRDVDELRGKSEANLIERIKTLSKNLRADRRTNPDLFAHFQRSPCGNGKPRRPHSASCRNRQLRYPGDGQSGAWPDSGNPDGQYFQKGSARQPDTGFGCADGDGIK